MVISEVKDDSLLHCADCFHTMNWRIARVISQRYPIVYETDKLTKHVDENKLGTYSIVITEYG